MTVDSSLTARSDEAARYVDGVAAQLADLPDEDRADLLDELAAHVDELVAEGDTPLTDRLGSPAEYAAELRASAGLPPARARGRAGAQAFDRLRSLRRRRSWVAGEEFLVALRPVWWLARGWILGAVLAHLTTSSPWDYSMLPLPAGAIGFWGTVLAIVVSVQVGRGRIRWASSWWRPTLIVVNVLAVVALVPILSSLSNASEYSTYTVLSGPVEAAPTDGVFAGGRQVWNIYPYDAEGRMLHDVRLFDQSGRPLSLGLSPDGTRQVVVDAQGRLVENAFPYRYLEPDGTVAHPDAGPTVVAPPLGGSAAPPATPAPSKTPSATPSPGASPTGGKR